MNKEKMDISDATDLRGILFNSKVTNVEEYHRNISLIGQIRLLWEMLERIDEDECMSEYGGELIQKAMKILMDAEDEILRMAIYHTDKKDDFVWDDGD